MPTLTVRVAGAGASLSDGGESLAGHVWYELNTGIPNKTESFGFAPIEHGKPRGPGNPVQDDYIKYIQQDYSVTIELTPDQYAKLLDFGNNPKKYDFDLFYNFATNSCIDFTWKALDVAGLIPAELAGTEGIVWPTGNIEHLKRLVHMSQVKWDALRANGYAQSFLDKLLETPKPLPPELPPPPQRDPLALDLNGDGTVKTLPISRNIHFDLDNSGFAERTSWVAPEDGLLVLDRNNNNFIDGGAELFGTETLLGNGEYAKHGFEALAEFDVNKDGVVDDSDAIYSNLHVWRDANSNGIAEAIELKSLAELNIKSIGTAYADINNRDVNNVDHREAGTFTFNNLTQGITNTLWFESDRRLTTPVTELQGNITIPDSIKKPPNVVGFGNTYSLVRVLEIKFLLVA